MSWTGVYLSLSHDLLLFSANRPTNRWNTDINPGGSKPNVAVFAGAAVSHRIRSS